MSGLLGIGGILLGLILFTVGWITKPKKDPIFITIGLLAGAIGVYVLTTGVHFS